MILLLFCCCVMFSFVPFPLLIFLTFSLLTMPQALSALLPEHQAIFSKIAPHIIDLMNTHLSGAIEEKPRVELNQVFVTRFNVQMADWQATTLPVLLSAAVAGSAAGHCPKPSLLNILFTGSHSQLQY